MGEGELDLSSTDHHFPAITVIVSCPIDALRHPYDSSCFPVFLPFSPSCTEGLDILTTSLTPGMPAIFSGFHVIHVADQA